MNKLFRISLFGFNKADVSSYIEKASGEFAASIEEKDAEIARLNESLSAARAEADALRRTKSEFDSVKDSISTAILKAEEKASSIIDDAKRQAMEQKLAIQNEILKESASLQNIRLEVGNLRRSVVAIINRFTGELEKHSDNSANPQQEQ